MPNAGGRYRKRNGERVREEHTTEAQIKPITPDPVTAQDDAGSDASAQPVEPKEANDGKRS